MDPAVIVAFGMDKFRKRMAELLADPKVPDADAFAVLWKEIADYDAARVAESRARYEGVEDPFDEYADDDDDSKEDEDEEFEAGRGEAAGGNEKEKKPAVEEEAPRILFCRL